MNIKESPFNRKHCPNNIAPICLTVPGHREAADDREKFMIGAASGGMEQSKKEEEMR